MGTTSRPGVSLYINDIALSNVVDTQTYFHYHVNYLSMKYHFYTLLLSIFAIACSDQSETQESPPPNIIFLLTDDQRWDAMGAMGNAIIQTPEMDKLAAEGVLFENAYVTTPICCTSRASILSGQYARRHQINDFVTSFSDSIWQQCYPLQLKDAGYHLGFIGKFGVGRGEDFPAADFDYWRGIPGQPRYEHTDSEGKYVHLTRILGDQCLEFLDSLPEQKPFCLSVSFKAPHVQDSDPRQFLFDSAYIDLFAETNIPPPAQADAFDQFPQFFTTDNEARRRWDIRFSTPEKYQASVKGYYRLIYGVDVVIGRIRKALAEKGLDQNTVIMLMGDNGFFLGEKGLAGKWYAYEESIRVPLVIYDPSLPAAERGQRLQDIALNIDIAPTMLAMAGQTVPPGMQGLNLRPLYINQGVTSGEKAPQARTDFLFEHEFVHPRIPKSEGVVSLTEKYFRYLPPAPEHEEYYDLEADPGEQMNRVDAPEYKEKVSRIKARLEDLTKIKK